ncbi:glutamine--fructose-6-phosphate transaminase (isomerizing) [Marinibactrum halimedae]|uniref:Glutamine--fructose-6-phosphate aminotransferase [isomerizing] n=1 Tax=Marinibactrum halimedae TaxID=1444977 RepID=A0AA37TB68_9GAMM|nr:glutamine--fructose-6-phosphate transaminase (isomerizing) [Marinibactrum halimedae]MCD9459999.1 glutamine--fructose-6-phosphate transaminase (isomerizing) [Marinibactrum halimedae]GLS28232.1 glutamine--fructose-6-phosphate aminotransferase [isomerizing] [Marinibactrum halimedae]
MCGIVGVAAQRNILPILIEGLKRLEYRGYDSAGVALLQNIDNGNEPTKLAIQKAVGKVVGLVDKTIENPISGLTGISHTRWATHGKPTELNAHPHRSGPIALVHNGIIENHSALRDALKKKGYEFLSETDSEVMVHTIADFCSQGHDLKSAVQEALATFKGAYAIGVVSENEPHRVIGARQGSPLVMGIGIDENYIASDPLALRQVTDRFIYLQENELVEITPTSYHIYDSNGEEIQRDVVQLTEVQENLDKGEHRHYMIKEIFEQPSVIQNTLHGRISEDRILEESFGAEARDIFDKVEQIKIIACGTSFHAATVAKYWFEEWAGITCTVEIASEYRYRKVTTAPNTLFVTISQSGETADTLAALSKAKKLNYLASLAVCNVPNSSLVRESDIAFMTHAGTEIGVASTKAFTTQLVALQLLVIAIGRRYEITEEREAKLVKQLHSLPRLCEQLLALNNDILEMSHAFTEKHHTLFLGRGVHYPIALEGALKLKEISYIHAEAYPAGELKHGPLALIDSDMPVVAVAPNNELLEKLKSNLEEVQARGGKLFVFADKDAGFKDDGQTTVLNIPHCEESISPIIYTLPLQLLSYHVAVNKGTDVDQPRNLAKSVTVE